MDVKRLKMEEEEEEEDRISELPDVMIHHILSFLPSTREAIRTTVLSKRWKNQWTRVPVLIFKCPTSGMFCNQPDKKLLRLINNALPLYDCSKINKLQLAYNFECDPDFVSKILFATTKHVEHLVLSSGGDCYILPDFLLESYSLIELELIYCRFRVDSRVNWGSLKVLKIDGWTLRSRPLIGKLVSGCPLLESLEFRNSGGIEINGDDDVIASKSLKRLILDDIPICNHMKISCPNLTILVICPNGPYRLPKKLIEISCPKLESVDMSYSSFQTCKLVNCPSLIYANLDFKIDTDDEDEEYVAMDNLEQLRNVKELTIKSWFIKILSALKMEGRSYSMSNNKSLTLLFTNFEDFLEITSTLHSTPVLEQLVIKLPVYVGRMTADLSDLYSPHWSLNDCGENYWNSSKTDYSCLVSHLKFIEICGFHKREPKCKLVINFIEFLLKNARMLEKLDVVISKGGGIDFALKVSQKVLSFPKYSEHTIVRVLCS